MEEMYICPECCMVWWSEDPESRLYCSDCGTKILPARETKEEPGSIIMAAAGASENNS